MKYALHFGPDAIHVDMEGTLTYQDSHNVHRLMKVINSNDSRTHVLLNIKKLKSMDSTGLYLFMLIHDLAKKSHCSLIFIEPQGQVLSRLTEAARYNSLHIAA
ncbi:MAG: STAS domain-containing protein [Bdellovibrionales bacterium]